MMSPPPKSQNTTGKMMTILKLGEVDGSNEVSSESENRRTPKLPVITHRKCEGPIWESAIANWGGQKIFTFYILAQGVHGQVWGWFRVLQIFKINQLKLSSRIKSNVDGKLTSGHRIQTEKTVSTEVKKREVPSIVTSGNIWQFLNLFYENTEGSGSGILEDLQGPKWFHSCCYLPSAGSLAGTLTRGLDSFPWGDYHHDFLYFFKPEKKSKKT